VYADDIQPEMLVRPRQNAVRAGMHNIETVLGTATDPRLPVGRIDLIMLVDVYHEFVRAQEMLAAMRTSLKPDGRLMFWVTVAEAKTEVRAEHYKPDKILRDAPAPAHPDLCAPLKFDYCHGAEGKRP
jgi:ubiquinone/menaquinone biosynthesis C-methylase UbiE